MSVRFRNVFCFAGQHELALDPKVYAITARYEGAEGRSNWGGKSALLRILGPLPLFGWHGFRLEDDWITDGESEAEIEHVYDNGVSVTRSRIRGKSTQVKVGGADTLVGQKGAGEAIEAVLRLSEDDFFATQYLRQKEIDRLLKASPTERHEMIVGWFDLGPLQACEQRARDDLNAANRKLRELEAKEAGSVSLIAQLSESLELEDGETVESSTLRLRARAADERREAAELQVVSTRGESIRAARRAKSELEQVERRGKELAEELKAARPDVDMLEEAARTASEEARQAEADVARLRVLTRGEFDGTCPVARGFQCPAKATINADAEKHRAELDKALAPAQSARAEASRTQQDLAAARALERQLAAKKGELDALGPLWRDLKTRAAGADEPLPADESERIAALNKSASEREAMARFLEQTVERVAEAERQLAEQRKQIEEERARRDLAAEAVAIFGRQGAQRRCSETYLSRIEQSANDLLATASIDLRVQATWGRKGQGLASTCERCGEPFPRSAKVKECGRCGAARGANVIERLDLHVSAKSDGGAADLGGIGLQLAAGAWLRARRSSPYSIAFLDEPLAALDTHNRTSVARALVGMLTGRYGLKQSFIVAHTSDAVDACPGRIEVVVKADGTRQVVAT